MQSISALLFDLDGTLADTDPLHLLAWQRCMQEHGVKVDEHLYREVITGRTTPQVVRHFFPKRSDAEVTEFTAQKEQCFRFLAGELKPLHGLSEFLHVARSHKMKTALVTNGSRENVEFMLKTLALEHEFDACIYGEELGVGKPDPLPYRLALERLKIQAPDAMAFEDSPTGIKSAVAAGIGTIGIASSQSKEVLLQAGAQFVVHDFSDDRLRLFFE